MDDANDKTLARRGSTIKIRSRLLVAGCWLLDAVRNGSCSARKMWEDRNLCVFEVEGCGAQNLRNSWPVYKKNAMTPLFRSGTKKPEL